MTKNYIQYVKSKYVKKDGTLAAGERLEQILLLNVYVNAEDTFQEHTSLADYASAYLFETLGDAGIGSRAALGVASLPGNAPVEIQLVAGVSLL
ncbi:RidA family protein [Virgibacillus kimchii]